MDHVPLGLPHLCHSQSLHPLWSRSKQSLIRNQIRLISRIKNNFSFSWLVSISSFLSTYIEDQLQALV
jgi:hypothetical protein